MAVPERDSVRSAAEDRGAHELAARSWWSQRFLGLLESFGLGSRLERGREYAAAGHVLELDVEPGIVLARVQGSRFTPYRVRIRPLSFSEHQWRRAEKAIAARASTLARLLAGELPEDIEEVLAGAKLALLPTGYDELRVTCTCPDSVNPCKHAAAAFYMLAERFDTDPFALLTLRGRTEDELIDGLRVRRARVTGRRASPGTADSADASSSSPAALIDAIGEFWRAGPELDRLEVTPLAAEHPSALLQRLGPFRPGGDGPELAELLAPAYAALAAGAERLALAD